MEISPPLIVPLAEYPLLRLMEKVSVLPSLLLSVTLMLRLTLVPSPSFGLSPQFLAALHIIVHRELVRVGTETKRVVFLLFHVDPVGDEAFVEDVAAQEE